MTSPGRSLKENGRFRFPLAVAVEGIDAFHLYRHHIGYDRFPNLHLYDFCRERVDETRGSGRSGAALRQWLQELRNQAMVDSDFATKKLAIICDCEDSRSSTFKWITAQLHSLGLPVPDGVFEERIGDWNLETKTVKGFSVSVLLQPVGDDQGALEHDLLNSVEPDFEFLKHAAEAHLSNLLVLAEKTKGAKKRLEAKTPRGRARWEEKVIVRTMLASDLKSPGRSYGAASQQLFNWKAGPLAEIVQFVKKVHDSL